MGMAENKRFSDGTCRDAVCVDAGRVYDSCADKDCCESLRVYLTERDQQCVANSSLVRVRRAELLTTCIDVEALPFNRGYYACDLTFYFEVAVEICGGRGQQPNTVYGICVYPKKVILFGSEGNVKVFASEFAEDAFDRQEMPSQSLPKCVVQVAEPVVLDAGIVDICRCNCNNGCGAMPRSVANRYGDPLCEGGDKALVVTLGLFSIVQLVRNVQMLMPVYDFCMPSKECAPTSETPCDAFKQMEFPVDEFFPPHTGGGVSGSGCSANMGGGCCSCGCEG